VKKLDKVERIEIPAEQKVVRFEFTDPPRSGDDAISMNALAKRWPLVDGGERSVFGGISGIIRRGEKVAVVGVNGAGKSTFLKVLAGQTEPTAGTATLGANVTAGYFSQHAMELLDPKKSVFETVQDAIPHANIGVVRNLCAAFLFQGDTVEKRIDKLSGGERSRVVLATLLARPINLLILDEPTNHLDIQSREILSSATTGTSFAPWSTGWWRSIMAICASMRGITSTIWRRAPRRAGPPDYLMSRNYAVTARAAGAVQETPRHIWPAYAGPRH
jgi:ATP-binding cassette subfamily F protein 3